MSEVDVEQMREDRMAQLAVRVLTSPDPKERAYALRWLDLHWRCINR